MRRIIVKYQGNCGKCGAVLEVGTEASYERMTGIFCPGCEPTTAFKERQEAKKIRYMQYGRNAEKRSDSFHARAHSLLDPIPFGQPVLVGHHSQAGHERRLKNADKAIRKACDESNKAEYWLHRASRLPLDSRIEEMGFEIGDVGKACWTNCNSQFEAEAHITKINARSLQVRIHHDVIRPATYGRPEMLAYPSGWIIKISLTPSGTFTKHNYFTKEAR